VAHEVDDLHVLQMPCIALLTNNHVPGPSLLRLVRRLLTRHLKLEILHRTAQRSTRTAQHSTGAAQHRTVQHSTPQQIELSDTNVTKQVAYIATNISPTPSL
jgi:hypothetical protein